MEITSSPLIKYMEGVLKQAGDRVIDEKGRQFSNKIKQYAQEYLDIIERDYDELQTFEENLQKEDIIKARIAEADIEAPYEWRVLIQNRHLMEKRHYWREIVTASLTFQTQMNELLGQKVELVYVFQDEKNNPTLYTIDESSLTSALYYQRAKDSGAIKGRFRQNQNNFLSYLTTLTEYQLFEKFNLNYFNYTYKQVIWRFNRGKRNDVSLIMWLNPSYTGPTGQATKWLKATVSKQGDIKEAYASVILDRQINSVKLFNDEKLDNNVNSFMEEVEKVDSESGLFKGDVTVGRTEYAIKGASASTLGLRQIIDTAKVIRDSTNFIEQDLRKQKEYFHNKASTRNHIEKFAISQQKKWQKNLQQSLKIETRNEIGMNILINYQPSDTSWF